MKKTASVFLLAITFTLSLFAMGGEEKSIVTTDGSTSMEKVIGALSEAFMENNTSIRVTYNPTGSGSGITAVLENRADFGLSSRDLKDKELALGLEGMVIALDGIAIIVNKDNPVKDLTMEQIAAIYKGEIVSWKDVGGKDEPIVLIGREAGSGTRDGFESITGTKDSCLYRQELTSTGDVITTVLGNPNAIGYTSLASVKDTVNILAIDGVYPTNETVRSGEYKVQRPFIVVTKKDRELSKGALSFLSFITSSNASPIILSQGAVSIL